MLNLTEYLLIKLSEECTEITDAGFQMIECNTPSNAQIFSDELNDLYGVVDMLILASNIQVHRSPENEKHLEAFTKGVEKEFSDEPKSAADIDTLTLKLIKKIALEALGVSKISCKCLVFGLDEVYTKLNISNRLRLSISLIKISTLIQLLTQISSRIKLDKQAQNNKRNKMFTYLDVSLNEGVIQHDCYVKFEAALSIANKD